MFINKCNTNQANRKILLFIREMLEGIFAFKYSKVYFTYQEKP